MAHFPSWFENGAVIGDNADGEALAVGLQSGVPWLVRLSKSTGDWTNVRPATREEIGKYDEAFLSAIKVSIDGDDRT